MALAALFCMAGAPFTFAQTSATANPANESLASALTPQAWEHVERAIERALAWLARQQNADGSFNAPASAQPAATSFAVMAYLSKGYLPGDGPYGKQLERAIDYVLNVQQRDGLLAVGGGNSRINVESQFQVGTVPTSSKTANYNHAISGLMLTEV